MDGICERAVDLLPYFDALRPDERRRASESFRTHTLAAGESFVLDPANPQLAVLVEGRAVLAADGDRTRIFPGDWTGEIDLLAQRGTRATIVATTHVQLATLDAAGLDAVFATFPTVAIPLLRELGTALKTGNDRLREISLALSSRLLPERVRTVMRSRRQRTRHQRGRSLRQAGKLLYRALVDEPRRRPAFWMLLGAVLALVSARAVVGMILRNGLQHHLFALIGSRAGHPIHIHHFNYGLIVVSTVGLLSLVPRARTQLRTLSFAFGFGVGLVVDEFALLWNLDPNYYQPSSRLAAGLVLFALAQVVYFPKLYLAAARRLLARVPT